MCTMLAYLWVSWTDLSNNLSHQINTFPVDQSAYHYNCDCNQKYKTIRIDSPHTLNTQ